LPGACFQAGKHGAAFPDGENAGSGTLVKKARPDFPKLKPAWLAQRALAAVRESR